MCTCFQQGEVEMNVTVLEESQKSVDFLVFRNVVREDDDCISHSHVIDM